MVRIGASGENPEIKKQKQVKNSPAKQAKNSSVFEGNSSYKVKEEDNFFKIARKLGLDIRDLAIANGWTYDKETKSVKDAKGKAVTLKAGMLINTTSKSSPAKPTGNVKAKTPTTHIVKSGDSPFSIAEKYQVSIRQLAAENNWDVKVIEKDGKEHLEVFANGKKVVLDKKEEIKVPKSVIENVGTINNLSQVMKVSGMSEGQRDIFVKFEGNPKDGFRPYKVAEQDDKGTWTIGYGYTKGVKKGDKWELPQCYKQLTKDYLQTREDIRVELGDDVFNKMPESLKEGLLDLVFNKGFSAINIDKFKQAVDNDDYKSAMKLLIYTKSMVDDKEMNGLYKRSLARLAHVYEGLSLEDKLEVKPLIDNFYKESLGKVSELELNNWWNPKDNIEPVKDEEVQTSDNLKSQYVVQEGDSSLISISRKLGISFQQLKILNNHLAPEYIVKVGDKININAQVVIEPNKKLAEDIKLSDEIVNIKEMDLDSQERLQKTNELIDAYAKQFNLSENAVNLMKSEAKKEYESWLWVDTDKLTAMSDILDASDVEALYKAIDGAIDESDEARKFASEVLAGKINKENIAGLISLAGGSKKFINMMKKVGGFDILKHSLSCLTEGNKSQQDLIVQYYKAVKDDDYSGVKRVFDNVLAQSAKDISDKLENTLVDDDDLNAILYKYQIQKVNSDNIIEVLKSNNIIAGICEAENDRSVCKEEIQKLFNILDKNYELDAGAREEFLKVLETEFRERSVWNPATWWIGTSKVSDAFNKLIEGDLKFINMRSVICKKMGWTEKDVNPPSSIAGKVSSFKETYAPTASGPLDGKRIVINAGHGGYNPNTKQFDPGALGVEGSDVNEWMVSRFVSQRVIEQLQAQGAEVVLVAGHWETVAYKNYKADMFLSIHGDERQEDASVGPKIFAFKGDKKDKELGSKILDNYINSDFVLGAEDKKFAPKDGVSYSIDAEIDGEPVDSMRASMFYGTHYVLQGKRGKASKEPSVLVEVCDMNNLKDLRNVVLGKYGDELVESIVDGVIEYWK